jgi:hypothetical protein
MALHLRRHLPKFALALFVATGSATAVLATEAANPAQPGSTEAGPLASQAQPASAQEWRGPHGPYFYHHRYYHHRHWHPGFWGPAHVWHPGFWVYF